MFSFASTMPVISSDIFNVAQYVSPPCGNRYYNAPLYREQHSVPEPFQWKFQEVDDKLDCLTFSKTVPTAELREYLNQYIRESQRAARRYDPFFGTYYVEEDEIDLKKFGKMLSSEYFSKFTFQLNHAGNRLGVTDTDGSVVKVFDLPEKYESVSVKRCELVDNKVVLSLKLGKPQHVHYHQHKKLLSKSQNSAQNANKLAYTEYLLQVQKAAEEEQARLVKQQEQARKEREEQIRYAKLQEQKEKEEHARLVQKALEEKAREQEIARLLKEKLAKQQRLEAKRIEQRLKFEKEQEKLLARQKRMEVEQQRIKAKQEELRKKYKNSFDQTANTEDAELDGTSDAEEDHEFFIAHEPASPSLAATTVTVKPVVSAKKTCSVLDQDFELSDAESDASTVSSKSTSSRASSILVEEIEDEEIEHYKQSLLNSPTSNAILEGI